MAVVDSSNPDAAMKTWLGVVTPPVPRAAACRGWKQVLRRNHGFSVTLSPMPLLFQLSFPRH